MKNWIFSKVKKKNNNKKKKYLHNNKNFNTFLSVIITKLIKIMSILKITITICKIINYYLNSNNEQGKVVI